MTEVALCQTDAEILACYTVMQQLRPHIKSSDFVACVKQQQQLGYQMVCVVHNDVVAAVAGYRIGQNLAWGRYVYVDDLVTDAAVRSQGLGHKLMQWLLDEARRLDCQQLHLDSGVQRLDAHRFYEHEGMRFASKHFAMDVQDGMHIVPQS